MRRPLGCLTGTGLLAAMLAALAVVGAAAFTGNGIFSPGDLNARTGAATLGDVRSHADLAARCDACHAPAWGEARMGDRCLECHTEVAAELADPAQLHFGLADPGNCRQCHTEHHGAMADLTRADMRGFPHDRVGFSLRAHAMLGDGGAFVCRDCHGDSVRSFDVSACQACHQALDPVYSDEHTADFGLACLECHDGVDRHGRAFDHGAVPFPLLGRHADVACRQCHVEATTLLALRRTTTECVACHRDEDPHAGRLGSDCGTCHTPLSWQQARMDHGRTSFALTGSHRLAACEGCHVGRRWQGIPTACAECHVDDNPHGNQFSVGCQECHQTTRWSDVTFDHSQSRFVLDGAHRQATCAACHAGGRYAGTPRDCIGCHRQDDRHTGELGSDCAACHRPTRWSDVTFDHDRSSFPLVGSHRPLACSACHTGGRFRGLATTCAGCHLKDDRHAGQFGTDCAACHRPTRWSEVTFDHARSSFPLTGAHRSTACSRCHSGGTFKGTPRACVNCHAEPGVHAGRFGTRCADCHSTTAWLPAGYNGPHAFPMNHGGAGGSCSTCHPSSLTSYTCTNCHDHSPDRMQDKHKEISGFSMDACLSCHAGGQKGD